MSKQISSLWVGLTGNISGLSKSFGAAIAPVKSLTAGLNSASGAISRTGSAISSTGRSLLAFTGIGAAVSGAFAAIKGAASGITLAADLEQTSVAFETMLKSASGAKALTSELTDFAAKTPFRFPEVASSAKQLLAYGFSAAEVTNRLTMLGDVASGISAPIGDIVYLFGTVRTQGKAMTKDLYQFANRGIPIFKMLAAEMGVTEAEVFKLAEESKISFDVIDSAFQKLTTSGGMFAGMTAKQSQTMAGLWSTLADTIGLTMARIVTTVVDAFGLRDVMKSLTTSTGQIGGLLESSVNKWVPIVADGFARAADALELLKAGFYGLKFAASLALLAIVSVGDASARLGNLVGTVSDEWAAWSAGLKQGVFEEADKALAAANESLDKFTSGANSAKVKKHFENVRAEAAKTAAQIAGDAAEDAVFNLSPEAPAGSGIPELAAAWNAFTGAAKSLGRDAFGSVGEKLKEQAKSLRDEAKSIADAVRTPAEVFADEIAKLKKLFDLGFISDDVFARAAKEAKATLDEATAPQEQRRAASITSGSAEALALRFQSPILSAMPSTKGKELEQTLVQSKKQSTLQQRMVALLDSVKTGVENFVEVTF